ncbi:MAG: phage major capsid protein [Sterolibacterium sp.]|nr:phage major capsid protein [Sterolibacterium sp.]
MEIKEMADLLEKQAKAWEEFKSANDVRLSEIEKRGHASDDSLAKIAAINADIDRLGKMVQDVQIAAQRTGGDTKQTGVSQEHKQAFDKFLRTGNDTELKSIERKAMNSSSDVDGGVLILPEIEREIDRIAMVNSALYRIAKVVNTSARSYNKRVKTAGMACAWPGEGGAAGETTEPKYANIEVVAYPAEVEPWVFNETLEDADIDLAADLANEAGIAFAEGLGAAVVTGHGVGKPRGITTYNTVANASYAFGSVGYIASGKSGAFASVAPADKLVDLQHSLNAQYRNGAVWVMSDTTLGTARQMKDGSGSYYLWQPDPAGAFGGRFLGSPVEVDDNMPTVAANSLSVAYGNFQRGYLIVNRTGTTLIRDNVTAKGTTKFNFRRRVGGGIYNFEAIKLLKFAAS